MSYNFVMSIRNNMIEEMKIHLIGEVCLVG